MSDIENLTITALDINPVQMALRLSLAEQLVDNLVNIVAPLQDPATQEHLVEMMNGYADAFNEVLEKYPNPGARQ